MGTGSELCEKNVKPGEVFQAQRERRMIVVTQQVMIEEIECIHTMQFETFEEFRQYCEYTKER